MQFLVFHLGADRYGLDTRHVARVLPLMEFKRIPQAPQYVAGLMNLRGKSIPVLDLNMLACGQASATRFDTRILLVDYRAGGGDSEQLGLVAERVSGTVRLDPSAFTEPGIRNLDAPYLGKVIAADGAILQLINIEYLLDDAVRAILFPPGDLKR